MALEAVTVNLLSVSCDSLRLESLSCIVDYRQAKECIRDRPDSSSSSLLDFSRQQQQHG